MSEHSRLAQIIAAATKPDGQVDRVKVFEGLQLTPDAPEALLLDVFFTTDDALRVWRTDAPKFEAALVTAVANSVTANFVRQQPDLAQLTAALTSVSDRIIRIAFGCGLVAGGTAAWACTWSYFHFLPK